MGIKGLGHWALAATFLSSCAGPTTPFGSPISVSPKFELRLPAAEQALYRGARISSAPEAQMFHSPFNLTLTIEDERFIPKNFRYEILYNGKRLDRWWKGETIRLDPDNPSRAQIIFEGLTLLPGRRNDITFLYYRDQEGSPIAYHFSPPSCPVDENQAIANLKPFNPRGLGAEKIERAAAVEALNPALLAGLVAQESSFNPKAVSWAKAVGLTQVTALANQEILALRPEWQFDPAVNELNFLQMRAAILSGRLSSERDWRLDQLKSLEGGALYLGLLRQYWQREKGRGTLEPLGQDPPMTDLLLASYNSGAYRVKKSLRQRQEHWLESRELNEARKYVMNVKSYCHAFASVD